MHRRRPQIKKGDICKFHKRELDKNTTLVVLNVEGDSTEGNSIVEVNQHIQVSPSNWRVIKRQILRKYIWATGHNVSDKLASKNKKMSDEVKGLLTILVNKNKLCDAEITNEPTYNMANNQKEKVAIRKWFDGQT